MSTDEVLLFLPHDNERVAAQVVSCFQLVRAQVRWHICTHLHCYSLFQCRDKKGFQSRYLSTVARALNGHGW